jgi:hypothetical protein
MKLWMSVLNLSTVVAAWILEGYVLPFTGFLKGAGPDFGGKWTENRKGSQGPSVCCGPREDFVTSAVGVLVGNGAVVECSKEYLNLISPLNVVEQSGKLRLIHDLSGLNKH